MANWIEYRAVNGDAILVVLDPGVQIQNRWLNWLMQATHLTKAQLKAFLDGHTGAETSAGLRQAATEMGERVYSGDWTNPTAGDAAYLVGAMAGVAETVPSATWTFV